MSDAPAALLRISLTVAAMACAAVARADAPEPLARARSGLESALRAHHPHVTRVELAPLTAPAKPLSFEVPAGLALEKRVRLWATAAGRNGKPRRVAWWWSVKAFAPTLVARRALRAGEAVRPEDLLVEERDVAGRAAAVLRERPQMAQGRWRAARFVAAGAALRRGDLEPAPNVLPGQEIRVSLTAAGLAIETTGIARDAGRVGDLIHVAHPASGERYLAEVTGDRNALIRGKP